MSTIKVIDADTQAELGTDASSDLIEASMRTGGDVPAMCDDTGRWQLVAERRIHDYDSHGGFDVTRVRIEQ